MITRRIEELHMGYVD